MSEPLPFKKPPLPTSSWRATAVGLAALGALAIGAISIGSLAIGRLAIGRLKIRKLEVDELSVRRLNLLPDLKPRPPRLARRARPRRRRA
jgi:hypothetical protein